uniref:Uncharacterized protein n=1 Tax=Strigamia maritima TaxID=126957 RepID=T1IW25_STRMM
MQRGTNRVLEIGRNVESPFLKITKWWVDKELQCWTDVTVTLMLGSHLAETQTENFLQCRKWESSITGFLADSRIMVITLSRVTPKVGEVGNFLGLELTLWDIR